MAKPVTIYRGQTINGSCELRLIDTLIPGLQSAYVIPDGALVEMLWPGTPDPDPVSVILSTATSGEITISNSNRALLNFQMSSVKSLLLLVDPTSPPSVPATIDVRVTNSMVSPPAVDIFEKQKVYYIVDKANPG